MQFAARKRVRLPHWDVERGNYFVTFNLFDAMPAEYQFRMQDERRIRIAELERLKERATPSEMHAIEQIIRERAEEYLDLSAGACWMKEPCVAQLVADAIEHFDTERYLLFGWCVMPNHVHVLFRAGEPIVRTLHSWKSFTAKIANEKLGRRGEFWQHDYYDRSVRDQKEFMRTVQYIAENPFAAGLRDWKWVKTYPDRF